MKILKNKKDIRGSVVPIQSEPFKTESIARHEEIPTKIILAIL